MTLEEIKERATYYKNLDFQILASQFESIYQDFLAKDTEIQNLKEQLTKTEAELSELKAQQQKGEENGKEESSAERAI